MIRLIFIALLTPLIYSAQETSTRIFTFRPQAGFNACQVHGDNYSGFDKFGILLGATVHARLNDRTSLEFGFLYSQKGARHNQNPAKGDYNFYRLHLNYIDMPLMLHYFLNPKYFITVGPSVAYLFSYSENIDNTDFTGFYTFENFEYGVNAGLGRTLNDKFSVEVRTSNSIAPIRGYGRLSTVFYPNPVARFFNKGFYNNILSVIVSYKLGERNKSVDKTL